MTSEHKIVGGIVALTIAVMASILLIGGRGAPTPIEAKKVESGQTVRDDSQADGPKEAKVTLVEFGDFQCPACGAAHPVLKQVKGNRGNAIRFVWRNYPLSSIHRNADAAARAAEAAGLQGQFWPMHNKLFETQNSWSNQIKPRETFIRFAKDLGLNGERFGQDFDSQKVANRIALDKGDGNALGVDATPTIFLNGQKYTGETSAAAIEAKIDELMR